MKDSEYNTLFPMVCTSCNGQSGITFCANCNSTGVVLAYSIETQLEARMPAPVRARLQWGRHWRRYLRLLRAGATGDTLRAALKRLQAGALAKV